MDRKVYQVSELNSIVKGLLEESYLLRDFWLEGEISNLRIQSSGQIYFSLKDEQSQVRGVMFAGRAKQLRFRPQDEQKVLVNASVSLYERDGQFQLLISAMEPLGVGALALALEQLKQRLAGEGLFDERRKRPLPLAPRVVGIVTSPSGAALRDMIHVLRRRYPQVSVILAPSLVQGEGAGEQLVAALQLLNQLPQVEVIIIGRGGGSLEDLWCFNEEEVIRAIAASRLPVISAVGHETDFTLADLAADLRAPTPSAAAELVVPEVALWQYDLSQRQERLALLCQQRLRREQEHLASQQSRLDPARLLKWVRERRGWLAEYEERLAVSSKQQLAQERRQLAASLERLMEARSLLNWVPPRRQSLAASYKQLETLVRHRFALAQAHLGGQAQMLQLLSPLQLLGRGYATLRNHQGEILTSVANIRTGDDIEMELKDGIIEARVIQVVGKEVRHD
ncbi:MAG: exodeoxyribonuclease VII large subunit [Symbiobacteriaceae bacterium]|nr:exodeoxyribonuclease VII large subunit [Symbiobacteriaceae bacterium]